MVEHEHVVVFLVPGHNSPLFGRREEDEVEHPGHNFNVNDNMIVLVSSLSMICAQLIRAFAKTETVFFASVGAGFGAAMFSAPIRAQMTRCVPPEENGKVS